MHELNEDFTKRLPPPEAPPETEPRRVPPGRRPPRRPAPPAPPPPPPDDDDPPISAAPSPEIDPARWEDFAVFRETFLVYVSHARYNAALRVFGELLFEMVLETWGHWPDNPEGYLRGHLRAVVADLRHLEGCLSTLGENPSEDDPYEAALCRTSSLMSAEVGSVAEHIERKLGTWRGEPS